MSHFFNKLKNPCFWPIFPIFRTFFFSQKIQFCHAQLHTMPKFRKNNDPIPRKRLDRRTDGRTNRLYFIGPFRLPPIKRVQNEAVFETLQFCGYPTGVFKTLTDIYGGTFAKIVKTRELFSQKVPS